MGRHVKVTFKKSPILMKLKNGKVEKGEDKKGTLVRTPTSGMAMSLKLKPQKKRSIRIKSIGSDLKSLEVIEDIASIRKTLNFDSPPAKKKSKPTKNSDTDDSNHSNSDLDEMKNEESKKGKKIASEETVDEILELSLELQEKTEIKSSSENDMQCSDGPGFSKPNLKPGSGTRSLF